MTDVSPAPEPPAARGEPAIQAEVGLEGSSTSDEINASISDVTPGQLTAPQRSELEFQRGRGRPKGSKNKQQRSESTVDDVPKRRGRPPGTGYKQKARAASLSANLVDNEEDSEPKRPVGRPRKNPVSRTFSASLARTTVPGMPAVMRSNRGEDSTNPHNLHSMFLPPRPSDPSPHPTPIHPRENPPRPPAASRSVNSLFPDPPQAEDIVLSPEEDDDDYTGLLNDGVGDEDLDEDHDEDDDNPSPESASHPRRTARPLATWLHIQFKARVAESSERGSDGLPPLYREGKTFWFPREDPYFSLKKISELTPEKLFHAQFFLWDPAALVPSPCPCCQTQLYRHAVIDRPRRCVDLDRTFYIIGYRYRCPKCLHPKSRLNTVTFRSWDSRILQKLPRALSNSFPAMLSYRSAISESVFMFM
ncbi:hypothetical protein C8J57DRAFT_1658439 [Mycena rebaudengoi]|nr:hypothetical protein C8J57DRAFT_1658439 [Mycena rebaudengoi]